MGITIRDARPGESPDEYLQMLRALEDQLSDCLTLGLRNAHQALARGDYEGMNKALFGKEPTAGKQEAIQKIVTELHKLSGELQKRIHKAAPTGSPALASANELLVQGISIQAAAKLLAQSLNRPEANLVQSLQAEVNQEMQKGAGFDAALETAKDTISRRVFAGSA